MDKQIETNIPVIFQTLEKYDNGDIRFEKVKIWLMHTGLNLNGSVFEKDVVEKALPSLANTPILAFIEENSEGDLDFSDHRMVLHRKEDGDITLKYLGQAIGLIPESNNAHWEKRVTDDGEEKEYLVVDGLIWTKWDEPLAILKQRGLVAQSMELSENYTGHWNHKNQFVFDSFQFFGACLLGKEVLPAMKNSTAEMQFSQNENLHKYIEQKLTEFNSMFSDKGGNQEMEQVNQEVTETVDETAVIEEFEQQENTEIEATETEQTEETQVEETTENVEENFEQTEETVAEEVAVIHENEEIITADETIELIEATVGGELGSAIGSNIEGAVVEVNEFEIKFNDLQAQYDALLVELNELKEFKRNTQETELASKFEGQLSEEELKAVFEASKESTLEDVEKELFALVGKKSYSIKKVDSTPKAKVAFSLVEEKKPNPYGDFFK